MSESPGWKYDHWEMKGVPVRIEVGGWVGGRGGGLQDMCTFRWTDGIAGPPVSAPRPCFPLQLGPKGVEADTCLAQHQSPPLPLPTHAGRPQGCRGQCMRHRTEGPAG